MKYLLPLLLTVQVLIAGCVAAPPQPALRFESAVNPEAWARIPAGEFLMGQHNRRVTLDYDYEIMVTLVTNAEYARYLNQALAEGKVKLANGQIVGWYPGDPFSGRRHEKKIEAGDWLHVPLGDKDLRIVREGQSFAAKPNYENHPAVAITWFGAKAYCDYAGGRLPTEAEWEKAARGTTGLAFPWGNEIALNNANFYGSRDPFERTLGAQGDTSPVGFYDGQAFDGYATLDSPSPYGLYDMAGNVWQWTNDVQEGIHYRFMRGGSKGTYAYNLRVWSRNSAEPDYYGPSTGFRCVRKTR